MGHPGHEDPVYAELNDYLMAIQIMRYDDPRAHEIFETWKELRDASWKIRELTDEQDLMISSIQVMDQIAQTKKKRKHLLTECRSYFADVTSNQQAIRVALGSQINVDWNEKVLEVQVQHTKVILIALQNTLDSTVALSMESKPNDQILFWNKQLVIEPNATRFTYLICSPLNTALSSNSIQLVDDRSNSKKITVQLKGRQMVDAPHRLTPGESITKVKLPGERSSVSTFKPDFENGIVFNITDKETDLPLPAMVTVTDAAGKAHWAPLKGKSLAINRNSGWKTAIWEHQPGPYFYIKGETTLGLTPEKQTVTVRHGFEYQPQSITVPENGQVNLEMEPWINMPELGWYSGHTHIHTTDVGIPVQFNQHWPLVSQAEDLQVSAILTLKGEWVSHAIYADEYPMGVRKAFSTDDHILVYGEEYRSNPYGHLAFIGLDHLIQPISSGALGELGGPDYPANAAVLDQALAQGANTIAAHFGNFTKEDIAQIKSPWPSTGFEMPVDIALGKIQLAEIYGNGGQQDVWYDILNCGFRVPATAGPDWVIKDSPRVYVYLGDQEFTFDNWRTSLGAGRSFITKGPMLFFEVNGKKPGSEINLSKEANEVSINAEARLPRSNAPVEIVFNGEVIYQGTDIDATVTLNEPGWLAARCKGAHSNPVWINFEGLRPGQSAPALKFISIIDQLIQWVDNKGLFENDEQKQEVLSVLSAGRKVYQEIVQQQKDRE